MSLYSFSQSNFSGTWLLKTKQQVSGPEYINALPKKITIDQQKDSIVIETVSPGPIGNDITSKQIIATDSKPFSSVGLTSKRKFTRTFQWDKAGSSFMIKTIFYTQGDENEIDFTRVETWQLKDNTLLIDRKSIETRSDTWETIGTFSKQ
jgi:hypothetical protein